MVFSSLTSASNQIIPIHHRYVLVELFFYLFCYIIVGFYLSTSMQLAHYHSGGLRINPNLYACGKVCLSLLNTWPGSGCEKWNPSSSTMLQVLVSIQALVLNAAPYFNEPGYEQYANSSHGDRLSSSYNEETFLHSCKTMLYTMRRPPLVSLLFSFITISNLRLAFLYCICIYFCFMVAAF